MEWFCNLLFENIKKINAYVTLCTLGSQRQWRDGWERGSDRLPGLMYSHLTGHHFPSRTVIVSVCIQVAVKPLLGLIVIMHSRCTHMSKSKLNINLTTIKLLKW